MIPTKYRPYIFLTILLYFIAFLVSITIPSVFAETLYNVIGVANNDVLNIRAGPSAKQPIVGAIPPNGRNIQVTGSGVFTGDQLWLPITYRGITGWVNGRYIVKTENSDTTQSGSDRFTDQVKSRLVLFALAVLGSDYQFTHEPFIDSIRNGQTNSLSLTLHPEHSYAIIGVCDSDCKDIDLRLYDERDNLIDSDLGTDDFPEVKVTPRWTAKYRIEVIMNQCISSPCRYGLGVFGK